MDVPNRQRKVRGEDLLNLNKKAMLPTKAVEIIKKAACINIGSGEDRVFWRDHWVGPWEIDHRVARTGFFIKVICFESG